MSKQSTSTSGGIGFVGALTILFIALKLLNKTVVATWSWWWVLSPIWISAIVLVAILVLVFAGGAVWFLWKENHRKEGD